MASRTEAVDRALADLARALDAALTSAGWSYRALGRRHLSCFTRETGDGVIATVEVTRASFRLPEGWPIDIAVRVGVGYEPALGLMPLLTLPPDATLVPHPSTADRRGKVFQLTGEADVPALTRRIVDLVDEHALSFAGQFPDPATIEAVLRAAGAPPGPRANHQTKLRLTLLAASGRQDEVRVLLASYAAEARGRRDRRFVRQLTRWLDAGGPPVPPVADTLAKLPAEPRPSRRTFSDARDKSRLGREAVVAARAQAEGKSVEELTELVAAEYARRNLEIAPSSVATLAGLLHNERKPFGRARSTLRALGIVKAIGADSVRAIKNRSDPTPDWLQPPERASYPVHPTSGRYATVLLDPDTEDWLATVMTEAPRRMGAHAYVDIWLTREDTADGSPELVTHIGDRRVGTVQEPNRPAFEGIMRAAALFDEDPYLPGRLSRPAPEDQTAPMLEIPLPTEPEPAPGDQRGP